MFILNAEKYKSTVSFYILPMRRTLTTNSKVMSYCFAIFTPNTIFSYFKCLQIKKSDILQPHFTYSFIKV